MWFRQDLRLKDNPAFTQACKVGEVIPIYIRDESLSHNTAPGSASNWWLHHSLTALNASLEGALQIFSGNAGEVLKLICKHYGVNSVYWNRCYEPEVIARDSVIKTDLQSIGIQALSTNGSLLWEPMSVLKKDGTPYRVFTPYYKYGCSQVKEPRFVVGKPKSVTLQNVAPIGDTIASLKLLPSKGWDSEFYTSWQPGEAGAGQRLQEFINNALSNYKEHRNVPSIEGTSKLSPSLHFGEISPNQVWYAIKGATNTSNRANAEVFLSEIGWREFSYYLLFHFPNLITENFNSKFNGFKWLNEAPKFKAWKIGATGVPIIDAGMRELWRTGYMHNRVRMIVGSFLVKNLLIDWRKGERWFWDCLVDADQASNTASWQWVAGSGADAAPYFRVFNPVLQGEKFDATGEYVKRYCPELGNLASKYIHKPWEAPRDILAEAGVELGSDYPHPIVDLKVSRQRALERYAELKK